MNTNSNLYTIIYSAIIVILVAAILAFASTSLKPRQEANEKAETIRQMLSAAHFASTEELGKLSNEELLKKYSDVINKAFLINSKGEAVKDLELGKNDISKIEIISNFKVQNKNIKKGNNDIVEIPVYVFDNNGEKITVLPIYGGGLWGPVWGYIALKSDYKTIIGAYFDHESETPGLGAKIKDDQSFRDQFVNKSIEINNNPIFDIVKGGAPADRNNAIDAITGATLTSNGLNAAINTWLEAYKPYLLKEEKSNDSLQKSQKDTCENHECEESNKVLEK